ncbi:MAG: hypothetical protein JWQ38_1787 [Flavipsychrobacter sp.]|nr:hypothetical protein [Flavipsychrobacter sp.]
MGNFTRAFRKSCVMILGAALAGSAARAATYTAVLSGNFNSALTWGGSAPGALLTTDNVIIPAGVVVTMTGTEVFSGTSSLTVLGTLATAPGATLVMTSGALAGTGSIAADSMVLGLTSGFSYTGSLTTRKLTSLGATIATAANVKVAKLLTLASGALTVGAGTLTMGSASVIDVAGGTITTAGGGLLALDSLHNITYRLTSALAGMELGGLGVDTITVNTPGTVTMAASTTINGTLSLASGNLALAGNTLTFGPAARLLATGTGTITGSTLSNVVVNTTGGLAGALRFATGLGGTLNNLVVNTTTGVTTLGSDVSISNLLTMTTGALALNGHTLTLNPTGNIAAGGTGTLTGSTLSSLVINTTGGLTGSLNFTTGSSMLNNLTLNTVTGGATLASDLAVNGFMTLTSGALSLAGHTLTLNPTADISALGTGTLTGSATSNLVINTTGGLTGMLNFTTGGNMLNNLTLNTATGGAALASDLAISGLMTLTSGSLSIVGRTLTLNPTADVSASGTGTLTGSATSNLVVNTTGSLTGALRFATGTNTLNNFVVNTGAGTGVSLGSDLGVNGLVTLTAGTLTLAGHTLTLNPTSNLSGTGVGTITGSTSSSLVVKTTGGLTGALRFAAGAGSTLKNLTVNTVSGATTLASDLKIDNLLTLTSGAMAIANNTLTFATTGNIAAGGTGTITGSALSSLVVNTTGGLTSALNFTTGSNMLNNLTLNTVTGGLTLASDLAVSGLMTLTSGSLSIVGRTLTLNPAADVAASGTGTLTGSATSNLVVNTTGSLTGALRFATGANTLNNFVVNTGAGTGVSLGSDLGVSGLVTLTAGTLTLAGHTLTLNTAGNLSGTGAGTITGSTSSSLVVNTIGGLTGALRFAAGAGSTLKNLTVNTASGATTLASDLKIDNLLTLTSGTLAINGNTLTLNTGADLSSGTGTLTGSSLSNLVVNTTFSPVSALNFAPGGKLLNNLTINMGSGSDVITLASNLAVQGMLTLQSGKIKLGANDLAITSAGTVTGGSANSYVMTDGTGSLIMNLATSAKDTFKVGTVSNFAPMVLAANTGAAAGSVSVNVVNGVLSNGTTGSSLSATDALVNSTWFVSSTAATIDYDMTAMWNSSMEVNGFDRKNAYISHYTSGAWDVQATSAATAVGSMYAMTRKGITSLSPFMVAQGKSTLAVPVNVDEQKISIYPNPATNMLNFATTATISNIEIVSLTGQVVKSVNGLSQSVSVQDLAAGTYFIHFYGADVNKVLKFVKQ